MAKKKTKKQKSLMRRLIERLGGLILILIFIAVFAAVAGYHPQDPGANAAGVLPVRNYLGYPGAYLADCVKEFWFGLAGISTGFSGLGLYAAAAKRIFASVQPDGGLDFGS